MDDVAEATRAVSDLLDNSDIMGQTPYLLEVTSRGVDRPLTLPRHWRRNVTRLVKVTLIGGGALTGRISACTDTSATLAVDGKDHEVLYADVAKALVQVEFNRKRANEDKADLDEVDEDMADADEVDENTVDEDKDEDI